MSANVAGENDVLPLTGERTLPDVRHENYWFRRHEAVYAALVPACRDAMVLDAGVGEGYGAAMLAGSARRVVAVELDPAVAAYVGRRHRSVLVTRADLQALPLPDAILDAVVGLQVIEHLHDQPGFLAECARVLRPGGRLHCATPNRLTFSPGRGPGDTPLNPFHTRELDAGELAGLVAGAGLRVERMEGLHHGPALRTLDRRHGGSVVDAQIARAVSGADWPESLASDVAAVAVDDFVLGPEDLDACLDLVVTAAR